MYSSHRKYHSLYMHFPSENYIVRVIDIGNQRVKSVHVSGSMSTVIVRPPGVFTIDAWFTRTSTESSSFVRCV